MSAQGSNCGAWLLAHSKRLDAVSGAERLENIEFAGRVGRLYNILRRGAETENSDISAETVNSFARLNNIDVATRRSGLQMLTEMGRVDISSNGSVSVLGATTRAVLEATEQVYDSQGASSGEDAVLYLSNKIAERPLKRDAAEEEISDLFKIKAELVSDLVDIAKKTAIIDEEPISDYSILFNSNVFRDSRRAEKSFRVLEGLGASDAARLEEAEGVLRKRGAVYAKTIMDILGEQLYRRLVAVGYFDQMEIVNQNEVAGYVALPDSFQRYGQPFAEDPVDDAKALLASLTYGMTRSSYTRGSIRMPTALLGSLIEGRAVGPVTAIGQDYKALETRGVVQVFPDRYAYSMKLLKPEVGKLAMSILKGQVASEEALLLSGSSATNFVGPAEARAKVRAKCKLRDDRFVAEAIDRIRSGI